MLVMVAGSVIAALRSELRPGRDRPGTAGLRRRAHPGRHQHPARRVASREGPVRRGVDERDAGHRRRDRAPGVRPHLRAPGLAGHLLGLGRDRGRADRRRPGDRARVGHPHPGQVRLPRGGAPVDRPHQPAAGHLQGWHLGLDERADARAVPGGPGGAGGLGAVRAARQPADGRHPHLDPQAGAAHQHRVATGGLRDVRQPARHHPTAAAPREHRLRLRHHRRRRRALHAAQQPGDGGVRAGLGRDHPAVRREDHAHHRMRAVGRRLRGPRVPHRGGLAGRPRRHHRLGRAPPSATPRCPL